MKTFITKNYVFISGLLSALTLIIQQSVSTHITDWKAIGFAALVAVLGFVANQWKGKGLTATGLIGSVAGAFVQLQQSGSITWSEFALAAVLAIVTTASAGLSAFKPDENIKQ